MKPKSIEKSCYKYKYIWSDKNKEKCEYVALSCNKKFIFNCDICIHEYEQSPNSKSSGNGCPYCSNKKLCGKCEFCLEKSCFRYKDIWSDNNNQECEYVALQSHKKFIFNCDICSHEYYQRLDSKTNQGLGCPYCSNRKRCGDCELCLKNSCFRYKDTWSDKNNQDCEKIALSCNKKFIFNCDICNHEYEQSPASKSSMGRGCPYCSNQKRCGECERCLENSCDRYKDIWSDKNNQECEYVALSSSKKFIFNCLKCIHEYEQSPANKSKGVGCPYCDNKSRCGDCELCLKNSCFRYKDIWSDKNKDNCEKIAVSNGAKYFFNCLDCSHEYEQSPNNKTSKGQGCPYCVNKTELKVNDFLKEQNVKFKRQFKIKNIRKYYDFYLPDFNLILEIDGNQHFRQVSNWGCHKETTKNDIQKMQTGIENSISFLRIYQPDIFNDKIDWKTIILKNLYKRTLPDISYVSSKTDIYDSHQFLSNQLE
jgi:very-short-patch-repair endonuclease